MAKRDPTDPRNFVIIGGGAAGLNCAETLRQSGYTGKITMVCQEKILPYDRTKLSKSLPNGEPSKFVLRDEDFLKAHDIDVVFDTVYSLHTDLKKVTFSRGKPMDYDKILIATGGSPRKLKCKVKNKKNVERVYYLRSASDV